ncbi:MAG: hypothetical protein LBS91_08820 [Clostridiales Family XIII bacterium]|jgi:hypothetical protein|nr:hypothetical protein [Clostridiales Family XIII bacterium]
MLSKLIKYEFRAMAKTFFYLYIALVAITLVNVFTNPLGALMQTGGGGQGAAGGHGPEIFAEAIKGLAFALYIVLILAVAFVSVVLVVRRFYTNLLGDQGYLTLTLPAGREQHMAAKLIVGVVWNTISAVLIGLTILLQVSVMGNKNYIIEFFGAVDPLNIFLGILLAIVGTASFFLMTYAAMAIGPNLVKNHRLGGSILAFVIIVVIYQILSSLFMAGGLMWNISNPFRPDMGSEALTNSIGSSLMVVSIAMYAVTGVICWFLTRFMLRKKLNLA